jgi:subtilisin family serine protease
LRNDTGRISARLALITGAAALICGTAVCATAGTAAAAPAPATPTGVVLDSGAPGAIPDSYIVILEPGAPASATLTSRYGGEVLDNYDAAAQGFHARMTAEQARHLAADQSVRYVEQDAVVTRAAATAKPAWGLDRIDQTSLPLSKTYTAPAAAGVTAYVIDTGIRLTHKQFEGRASSGYDFVDRDTKADDCNGHGTHVAGTIGGATYGVAKDVKLVGVRVLDCNGDGAYSDIIAGVDWVTKHAVKPAVANMSLGGERSKALDDAVNRSIASGVTYVVAAGNDNKNACQESPADDATAITVGASDSNDRRASFSDYGRCIDMFAPGVGITSAWNTSNTATQVMDGTSMATPHVTGAAALVLGAHPGWTPAQVTEALTSNATTGVLRSAGSGSPNKLLYTGFLNTTTGAAAHG